MKLLFPLEKDGKPTTWEQMVTCTQSGYICIVEACGTGL